MIGSIMNAPEQPRQRDNPMRTGTFAYRSLSCGETKTALSRVAQDATGTDDARQPHNSDEPVGSPAERRRSSAADKMAKRCPRVRWRGPGKTNKQIGGTFSMHQFARWKTVGVHRWRRATLVTPKGSPTRAS